MRLVTWKEIAAFLGRDEKTARRWEAERNLPVYRAPGQARSTVYADPVELDAWLRSREARAEAAPEPKPEPEPEPHSAEAAAPPFAAARRPRARWALTGGALAVALAVGALGAAAVDRARPARAASPAAQALYLQGVREWSRRTPDSLTRAVDLFTQAVVRDPGDARAYAGLADCYNLLREFTALPASEAFPRAEAAAQRAVALDPRLADAHASLGFVLAWWRGDVRGAEAQFARALQLDDRLVKAWHWRATWRLARRDTAGALADIERAHALAPESDAILADRALILDAAGRGAEAQADLRAVAAERPEFQSPHAYLALIALERDDWIGWLEGTEAVARLRGDADGLALAAAGRLALARGGPAALWAAILPIQERMRRAGRLSSERLAESYARAGRADEALAALTAAAAAHEPDMVGAHDAVAFRTLRTDPRFPRRLDLERAGGGVQGD